MRKYITLSMILLFGSLCVSDKLIASDPASLSSLAYDPISCVCKFLPPEDVGRLAKVNKTLNGFAERVLINRLPLTYNEMDQEYESAFLQIDHPQWKPGDLTKKQLIMLHYAWYYTATKMALKDELLPPSQRDPARIVDRFKKFYQAGCLGHLYGAERAGIMLFDPALNNILPLAVRFKDLHPSAQELDIRRLTKNFLDPKFQEVWLLATHLWDDDREGHKEEEGFLSQAGQHVKTALRLLDEGSIENKERAQILWLVAKGQAGRIKKQKKEERARARQRELGNRIADMAAARNEVEAFLRNMKNTIEHGVLSDSEEAPDYEENFEARLSELATAYLEDIKADRRQPDSNLEFVFAKLAASIDDDDDSVVLAPEISCDLVKNFSGSHLHSAVLEIQREFMDRLSMLDSDSSSDSLSDLDNAEDDEEYKTCILLNNLKLGEAFLGSDCRFRSDVFSLSGLAADEFKFTSCETEFSEKVYRRCQSLQAITHFLAHLMVTRNYPYNWMAESDSIEWRFQLYETVNILSDARKPEYANPGRFQLIKKAALKLESAEEATLGGGIKNNKQQQ